MVNAGWLSSSLDLSCPHATEHKHSRNSKRFFIAVSPFTWIGRRSIPSYPENVLVWGTCNAIFVTTPEHASNLEVIDHQQRPTGESVRCTLLAAFARAPANYPWRRGPWQL